MSLARCCVWWELIRQGLLDFFEAVGTCAIVAFVVLAWYAVDLRLPHDVWLEDRW